MQGRVKRRALFAASSLTVFVLGAAVVFGLHAYRSVSVRQPNAYAMQSAGQLIVEHMRLHSGAWPKSWAELRDTCATTGIRVVAADADAEIEELRRRVEIDWAVEPARFLESTQPIAVVRLRKGNMDWFVGVEPNQMIMNYLKRTTEQ